MGGKWLEKGLVYKGIVDDTGEGSMDYIGMTARTFKERWKEHKYSMSHRNSKGPTELAYHIWDLNEKGKDWRINWEIIGYGKPFEPGDRFCMLCNREKTEIVLADRDKTLNGMNIIEKCRHMKKKMLGGLKEKKDSPDIITERQKERAQRVQVLLTPLRLSRIMKRCEVRVTPLREGINGQEKRILGPPPIRKSSRIRKAPIRMDL